jgi:hypothetical protein
MVAVSESGRESRNWWGSFEVSMGRVASWQIGPLSLWVERLRGEWRLIQRLGEDPLDMSAAICVDDGAPELRETDLVQRFGFSSEDVELFFSPLCADRNVISRPEETFVLPAGEESVLYVSTPLWLRIEAGREKRLLVEVPIVQPSDTWFGSSTREGALCYASRTRCRTHPDNLPRYPHRATTAVTLQNQANTPLTVERLNLPVLHLGLYSTADGSLWTEKVKLVRKGSGGMVELRLGNGWKKAPAQSELVTGARMAVNNNVLFRAFSSLFD